MIEKSIIKIKGNRILLMKTKIDIWFLFDSNSHVNFDVILLVIVDGNSIISRDKKTGKK